MSAIIVTIDAVRTRAGTQEAILSLAVPLEQGELIASFMGKVGKQVACAFAEVGAVHDVTPEDQKPVTSDSTGSEELTGGKLAQDLYRRGSWRNVKIWEAFCDTQAERDRYREWVALEHPCMICGSEGEDRHPHHWQEKGDGVMGGKVPDYQCVPLCAKHHTGNEGVHTFQGSTIDWLAQFEAADRYSEPPSRIAISMMAEFNRMKAKVFLQIASMSEITPELLERLEEKVGVKI